MIDLKCHIHDSSSLEMKFWLKTSPEKHRNRFRIGVWFAIPGSLDVNRYTYSRNEFYSDTKSYFRLITPKFSLEGIVSGAGSPFAYLEEAVGGLIAEPSESSLGNFEYHVKMYTSIFKSSVRERVASVSGFDSAFVKGTENVLESFSRLFDRFRSDSDAGGPFRERAVTVFDYGYEYLLFLAADRAFELNGRFSGYGDLISEIERRRFVAGYRTVSPVNGEENGLLLYRWSKLKKYNLGKLYFGVSTRRDGVVAEQLYYSLAAGLSMVFATIVAFSFQKRFGNFTMPLFVALVVSYMLKDRIKELMRYYFANKKRKRYYDTKTTIMMKGRKVGLSRAGFDFIKEDRIPDFVADFVDMEDYRVALYKRYVEIDPLVLSGSSEYVFDGVNNIVRFNFSSLLKNMDDRGHALYYLDGDGNTGQVVAERIYYLYLVVETNDGNTQTYRKYKLKMSRSGLSSIVME